MVIVVAGAIFLAALATTFAVLTARDARRAEAALAARATTDLLTGLPGRAALEAELTERIATGGTARFAVLLLRIDRFAAVNDTYGHDIGDELLVALRGQITGALAPGETVFRLGGPEFVVLCPQTGTAAEATARAEAFQQAIHVQYRIAHDRLRVSATAGVVIVEQRHTDPAVVLDDADAAVRAAARRGPGRREVFEIAMADRLRPADAPARLRAALDREELLLFYLPVVTVDEGRIVGVEALLRWADPARGLVGPREIFGLLEHTDLLDEVGDWVVAETVRHNVSWQRAHPGLDLMSTVNVSPRQLADPDFVHRVVRTVEEHGADPQRFCLEITEGALRTDTETTWTRLREAKDAGIQLALDDFGTGYSTFDYIRRFHLDVLKIDQVFVSRLATSKDDYAIVQQLVGLAHALDLVAIAEGVEQPAQAQALVTLDCDLAQGYLWSQPVPVDTISAMLPRGVIRPGTAQRKAVDWKAPTA